MFRVALTTLIELSYHFYLRAAKSTATTAEEEEIHLTTATDRSRRVVSLVEGIATQSIRNQTITMLTSRRESAAIDEYDSPMRFHNEGYPIAATGIW